MNRFDSPDEIYTAQYDNLKEVRMGVIVGDITIFEVSSETQLMHFKEVVFDSSPWSSLFIISVPIRFHCGSWVLLHVDVRNARFFESKNSITNSTDEADWKSYGCNS